MKILLVENPPQSHATVQAIARSVPSVVFPVPSSNGIGEALQQFAPDLIVSHHAPPKSSAIDVLHAARRFRSRVPLIALTETPDVGTAVECLRAGVADCVGREELFRLGPAAWMALWREQAREAQMRTADRLRASEEHFRLLADNFPGVLYLRQNDTTGSLLYLSEAVEELTGYPKQAFLDRTVVLSDLRHPDDRAQCQAEMDRAFAAGQPFHLVYRLRHRLGGWRWIEERGAGIRRNGTIMSVEGSLSDITIRRRLERRWEQRKGQLEYEVTHDALTGLVNRTEFERRLERAVQGARSGAGPHALCYLDLDRFKQVNDLDGHTAGDAVLRQVGRHLSEGLRARDTLARIGGDEFVLLLEHCTPELARQLAKKVLRSVQEARFSWKQWDLVIGVSIGIVLLTTETESAAAALSEADSACYAAKRRGGDCVHVAGEPDIAATRCDGPFAGPEPDRLVRPSQAVVQSNERSSLHVPH